jgi:hypothetical protein
MKYAPISLNAGAFLDACLLGLLLVSPWVCGYTQYEEATQCAVGLVVMGMGLSVLTDYPFGIIRLIPVVLHRLVEFASPAMFVAIPWVFFRDAGMMPIIATIVGLGIILNAALSGPVG